MHLDDCFESIRAAKDAGADIVKFQYFTHEKLYGFPGVMRSELPSHWLHQLAYTAVEAGLEFMCSVFDPFDVELIDPYVKRHKLASAEVHHIALIKEMARTGKEVLVSNGCATNSDIAYCLSAFRDNMVLMDCCPEYPSKRHFFPDEIEGKWGISDHSLDIFQTPALAKVAGASYLEKHFTAFPDLGSADRPHSLTSSEFKEMVQFINSNDSYPDRDIPSWKRTITKYGYFRPKG